MGNIEMAINHASDLTTFTTSGTITADEIIEMLKSYYQGIPTRLAIWDFRQADVFDISTDHLKKIVLSIKAITHSRINPKTAIVLDNAAKYGMGRIFETLVELENVPIAFGLFYDDDSARDWLFE